MKRKKMIKKHNPSIRIFKIWKRKKMNKNTTHLFADHRYFAQICVVHICAINYCNAPTQTSYSVKCNAAQNKLYHGDA